MKNKSFISHLISSLRLYKKQKHLKGKTKSYFKDKKEMLKETAKQWNVPFVSLYMNWIFALIFYGESSEYYVMEEIYKYNRLEKKKRLTVFRAFKLDYKYNKDASEEERDRILYKNRFNEFYKDYIKREWIYPRESSSEEIIKFIDNHSKVFCKPNCGTQGQDVFILSKEEICEDIIKLLIEKDYIVEEIIKQNDIMSSIHKESINTLRIFSIIDREGQIHIAQPLLRVGANDSVVDNINRGGYFYLVDDETGIVYSRGRTERDITKHIYHPGTNIIMPGFKIPKYEEICDKIKKIAKETPNLRYVGWDVAITDNGPVIIEGNIAYAATLHGSDGRYEEIKKYL